MKGRTWGPYNMTSACFFVVWFPPIFGCWEKISNRKKKLRQKNVNFFGRPSKWQHPSSRPHLRRKHCPWVDRSWVGNPPWTMTTSHREIYGDLMGLYIPPRFFKRLKTNALLTGNNSNIWMKMYLLVNTEDFPAIAMSVYWRVQVLCRNFQVLVHHPPKKTAENSTKKEWSLLNLIISNYAPAPAANKKTQINPADPSKKKQAYTLPESNSSHLKIGIFPKRKESSSSLPAIKFQGFSWG